LVLLGACLTPIVVFKPVVFRPVVIAAPSSNASELTALEEAKPAVTVFPTGMNLGLDGLG